ALVEGDEGFTITLSNPSNATLGTAVGVGTIVDNDAAPTVSSITMSDTALKIGDTALVTITFSEAVSDFDNTDVTVEQGTLSTLSSVDGGVTWTGTFTPTAAVEDTTNIITVANTYTDLSGNAGTGATGPNYSVDTIAPTASISMSDTALVSGETATVAITFGEAFTGFELSDLNVTGGVVTNLVLDTPNPDGSVVYTATFTPTADFTGTASVAVPAGSYTDLAGNLGSGD